MGPFRPSAQFPLSDPQILSQRPLTPEDFALIPATNAEGEGVALPADPIKKLRDSHHQVARLQAQGLRPTEISAITGYTTVRLKQLSASPAFQDLVSFYQQNETLALATLQERMLSINTDVLQELHHRLDETPEEFSPRDLLDFFRTTADRSGFGPRTTNVNVNVELSSRMEHARKRYLELSKSPDDLEDILP